MCDASFGMSVSLSRNCKRLHSLTRTNQDFDLRNSFKGYAAFSIGLCCLD